MLKLEITGCIHDDSELHVKRFYKGCSVPLPQWFRQGQDLFYDAVHLLKNVRNNLLNFERFIFPSFKFDGFKDPIILPGREIEWKFFQYVHEKDALLEANLRKIQS